MSASPLVTRDLAVTLGARPVLRGISLDVGAGQFVTVLGPNGSGKSTLIRTAIGLTPTVRGEVELFAQPLHRFKQWHRIGYVPQRSSAASGVPASVWEVVASGRLTRRRLARPLMASDRAKIHDALELVGMLDRSHDSVSALSGGQQQRVLIARALVGEPELLILDEPTAGVDQQTQVILADTLAQLSRSGATIVLVSHELGPIAEHVHRTVVMRDGRLAYDGAPLSDAEAALVGGPGHHHHHEASHDHTPHVSAPLDTFGDPHA